MASKIKVDQLEGSTGTSVTIPTGHTFTVTDGMSVAGGGTGLTSFAAGDVLYATGSTTLAKLPKGTAEQVLAMNSGATAPDWGSVDLTVLPTITVAKGGTNLSSFAAGDVLYATGSTTLAKLAKGSAADVLTMNAGATAPEWAAAAGGGKILQVTQRETTSATATTSTTLVATDQYAAITPSATSSNVIIMMNFRMHVGEGSGSGTTCAMGIKRDIDGGGYSDVYLPLDSEFGHWINDGNHERSHHARFTLTCLDAPNTTGVCTYKLYIRHMGAAGTGDTINHGGSNTEMSTILMEVDGS